MKHTYAQSSSCGGRTARVPACARIALLCACLALFASCATPGATSGAKTALKNAAAAAAKGFVTTSGGEFMLDGKPFRFAGTNNYYMHYESDKMLSDVLDDAKAMNFRVLRVWGFMNGMTSQNRDHNVYGMTEPPTKDSPGAFGIPEKKRKRSQGRARAPRLHYRRGGKRHQTRDRP